MRFGMSVFRNPHAIPRSSLPRPPGGWLVACLLFAGCGRGGCDGGEGSASAVRKDGAGAVAKTAAPGQKVHHDADKSAEETPPGASATPDAPPWLKPGYRMFMRHDDAQLCVFGDLDAQFNANAPSEVKPQRLAADEAVVFGVFPGYCVREGCDDRPSLECRVERQGSTLVIKSRYWGARKPGGDCGQVDCHPVTAGCATPPLPRGSYNIRHGDRQFTLKIPTTLRKPCIDSEPRTPPGD